MTGLVQLARQTKDSVLDVAVVEATIKAHGAELDELSAQHRRYYTKGDK